MINKSNTRFFVFFYCFLFILSAFSTVLASQLLQTGSRGKTVTEVQQYLYQLKYLKTSPTGYYGRETAAAVKSFQAEYGLKPDGKVGSTTLTAIREAVNKKSSVIRHTVSAGETLQGIADQYNTSPVAIMTKNNLTDSEVAEGAVLDIPSTEGRPVISSRGRTGAIQAIPWSIMDQFWRRGESARIIDLATGKSFTVKRYGGHYHSDTEPMTLQDTRILLDIYGGRWSWDRRAVVVQVRNEFVAASINGMPHGQKAIRDNGFKGHFCVHFLGSRIHKTGRIDSEHQAMVLKAAASNLSFEFERSTTENYMPETRDAVE